jgi:hypothetical protein
MAHVFISYSKKNEPVAKELCAALEKNALTCWFAWRDIQPGTTWPEAIPKAIADSTLMIVLISREAVGSKQVARELEVADSYNVPFLPVCLDQARPDEGPLQYFLGNKQWLDLHPGQYDVVVDAVRELLATAAVNDGVVSASGASDGRRRSPQVVESAEASHERPLRNALSAIRLEFLFVVLSLVSVVSKRERSLADLDLTSPQILAFGVRLLLYMTVIAVVLHIPAWSAAGVRFGHPAFMLSVVAIALVEQVVLCFSLYAAVRVVGTRPDLQTFVAAYCFLSIFQVMADVCLIPVQVRSILVQNADLDKFLSGTLATGDALPLAALAVLGLAVATSIALRVVGAVALFKAVEVNATVGFARRAAALVLAFALWIIAVLVIVQPFEANLYAAFGRH